MKNGDLISDQLPEQVKKVLIYLKNCGSNNA